MKKQKSTPWARLLMIACLSLIVFACRRELLSTLDRAKVNIEDPAVPMDVELAKIFYSKLKAEKDNRVNMSLYQSDDKNRNKLMSLPPQNDSKIINRKHILFKKAFTSQTERSTMVEIPIVYNQRFSSIILTDKSDRQNTTAIKKEIFAGSFDRLIIYKDKVSGKISHRIISFIPNIDYLRKNNNDISHNHITDLDSDFDGYLEYKEWDGTPLYLIKYTDGKRVKITSLKKDNKGKTKNLSAPKRKNGKLMSAKTAGGGMTTNAIICEDYVVEVWGEACVIVDPEGQYTHCEPYLISWDVITTCYDDGVEEPTDPCDYGQCGTGDPCIDYGDCGDGGSPGGTNPDPDPSADPPTPCANAKSMTDKTTYNEKVTNLNGNISGTVEHGWMNTKNADGTFSYKSIEATTEHPNQIAFDVNSPIRDFMHNHLTGKLGTFDGADINAMYTIYNGEKIADINTFTQTVVTTAGTYMLTISDVTKFKAFAENAGANTIDATLGFYGYSGTGTATANETAVARFLTMGNTGLTLLKKNSLGKFDTLTYSNNQLTTTNCN